MAGGFGGGNGGGDHKPEPSVEEQLAAARKAVADLAKVQEETLKITSERAKIDREMIKLASEQAKIDAETIKLQAEALKVQVETIKSHREMPVPGDPQKRATEEINKLMAEIRKLARESWIGPLATGVGAGVAASGAFLAIWKSIHP